MRKTRSIMIFLWRPTQALIGGDRQVNHTRVLLREYRKTYGFDGTPARRWSRYLHPEKCPGNTPFDNIRTLMANSDTYTPRLIQAMKLALWDLELR